MSRNIINAEVVEEEITFDKIRAIKGKSKILKDYPTYLMDESKLNGTADWLFFPKSEAEIVSVLNFLQKNKIRTYVSAARTGIVGACVPTSGSVLSTEKMNKILGFGFDKKNNYYFLRVEPGITLNEIDDKLREKLDIIHLSAKQAADIVRNLKTFAKKAACEQQLVNINHLIQEILRLMKKTFEGKNIQITTNLAPHLPETMADAGQIQQVLMNLILNAREAMLPRGGILTIKAEEKTDTVQIEVADTGKGIEPEDLKNIFESFFTTKIDNNQKHEDTGAGLGLAFCRKIIDAHNGCISVESEPAKGSTFKITLPKNR